MLVAMFALSSAAHSADIRFMIDPAQELGPLKPFWQATGFMPATDLEKPAMQESLRRIASMNPRPIPVSRPTNQEVRASRAPCDRVRCIF